MRTLLCVAVLLVGSCGEISAPKSSVPIPPAPAWVTAGEPAPYLVKLVGEKYLDVLRHADRVESFRIDSQWRRAGAINGYELKEKGPDLDAKQVTLAVRLTTSLESSFPLGAKLCGEIKPGVALRFHRGNEHVTALICFHCNEWYFEFADEAGENRHRRKLNFEGAQPQLLQLIQALFPRDAEIGAIEPLKRYSVSYRVAAVLPSSEEEIRNDLAMVYDKGPTSVLAKYLPEAGAKVRAWDIEGGLGDCALPLDGLLFVHTTKENHEIVSQAGGASVP